MSDVLQQYEVPPSPVNEFRLTEPDCRPVVRARVIMECSDAYYLGVVEGSSHIIVSGIASSYAVQWQCWLSRIEFEEC